MPALGDKERHERTGWWQSGEVAPPTSGRTGDALLR